MKTKNPFEVLIAELPAFSEEQAIDIAFNHFGLKAKASNLLSERDQNFLLEVDGDKKYVLKRKQSGNQNIWNAKTKTKTKYILFFLTAKSK